MNKKVLSWLGAIKVYGDVARYYLSLIQFILILIGFIKVMDYPTPTIIILLSVSTVLLIGIVFIHVRYIMPEEYEYLNRRDRIKIETLKKVSK